MPDNILDLDILRPKPQKVKLAGHTIDVSFIPVGITFDIDEIVNELAKYDEEALRKGGEEARKAFDLAVRMCALFCSVHHEEMDEDWFRANVSPQQVNALAEVLKDTLTKSYEGVEGYQGN